MVVEAAFFLHVLTGLSSCSLGPLVGKVKEYQVETIVDTLCTNMLSDKEQLRDISSIGLKTVISELPPAAAGKTSAPARHTEAAGSPSPWETGERVVRSLKVPDPSLTCCGARNTVRRKDSRSWVRNVIKIG